MIKHCLLPVAGYGTRFFPITKAIPKEMLPILNKPLIQYSVEEANISELKQIIFVTSKTKKSIYEYFQHNENIEKITHSSSLSIKESIESLGNLINYSNFSFVYQEEMLGLGHAIFQGKHEIGNNPFAVILPDDLCFNEGDSVLQQMIKIHSNYPNKSIIAIEEVSQDEVQNYGIISGIEIEKNIFQVQNMIEKPEASFAPSNHAIIGRYILQPEIFDAINETSKDLKGEIQITDALMKLAIQNKVLAYKYQGRRLDCGTPKGFVRANNFFLQKLKA